MSPRRGVSRTTMAIALAVVAIMAGASFYVASSSIGTHAQVTSSSSSTDAVMPTTTASPTTAPSTATAAAVLSGPDHQLIGDFAPAVPTISQFLDLNYTLYFTTIGTVPSPLNISLSTPAAISLSVTPDQIVEPGLSPYVNTSVTMRPSPSLAPGTYPVTVQATGEGATYTETLFVHVVKYLVVAIDYQVYEPMRYTVPVNTTVTWLRINDGGTNGLSKVEGDLGYMNVDIPNLGFDSRTMLQYQSVTYTFTSPGTYPFHCDFHPLANGVITVTP